MMHIGWRHRAAALIIALPALATGLPATAQERGPREPTMTLQGTGEVRAAPDTATVTSGVVTEAETAREALDQNNTAMRAVLEAIAAAGIEKKDVGTSGFSVRPRYVHPPQPKSGEKPSPPRIVGYTVSNQVHVTVRELTRLGQVLDTLVSVGANRVSGIQFYVDDDEALMDEARDKAMKDAQRKARVYARSVGVGLGRIMSIGEVQAYAPRPRALMGEAMAARADSVPVEPGEASLSVTVTVTWELTQ